MIRLALAAMALVAASLGISPGEIWDYPSTPGNRATEISSTVILDPVPVLTPAESGPAGDSLPCQTSPGHPDDPTADGGTLISCDYGERG